MVTKTTAGTYTVAVPANVTSLTFVMDAAGGRGAVVASGGVTETEIVADPAAARRTPPVRPRSPSPCLPQVTVVVTLAARRQLLKLQVAPASLVPDCLGVMNREV
jgi:hypothetical protein